MKTAQLVPFHESVITVLEKWSGTHLPHVVEALRDLVMRTHVPEEHADAVRSTFDEKLGCTFQFLSEEYRKPFHESIVDALEKVRSRDTLVALAELIARTVIPENHRVVREALDEKRRTLLEGIDDLVEDVWERLAAQHIEHRERCAATG